MDVRDRYESVFASGTTTERLVFFSDAVFAIAKTLLIFDLKVPDGGPGSAWEVISSQFGDLFAYALSFTIIGVNWMAHHRKFRVIKSHDGPIMVIDLVLLFFVAFLPFPTSLLSEYSDDRVAVVLYATNVAIVGVLQYGIWRYAWRHGFIEREIDEALYRYVRRNQLATPVVFGFSIVLAVVFSASVAMWSWLALLPVHLGFRLWDARQPSGPRATGGRPGPFRPRARRSPD